jgi:hypothetical protein
VTRVALSPASRKDLPLIQPWYPEASAAVEGVRGPVEAPSLDERLAAGGLLVITRKPGAHPIGLLQHRDFNNASEITFLAMAAGQRGWGYGSEAVRLFEENHQAKRYLVCIGERNGLAVYFWRLLGFRPAHADDAVWRPEERRDMIAMVRHHG